MKAFVLGLVVVVSAIAAFPRQVRFKDNCFARVSVTRDIPYSTAVDFAGSPVALALDLYEPADDTAHSRPLILLIHGGSFTRGNKGDRQMVDLCNAFARKGYVAASIDYRLGVPPEHSGNDFARAVYRAVEDAKSAGRFLVAGKHRINPERIFLGGVSAGAVTAVQYAFMRTSRIAAIIDTAGLNNNDNHGPAPRPAAIINLWGALIDRSWINAGDPAVLSFHGTQDRVVPYRAGYALSDPDLPLFGSECIDSISKVKGNLSVCYSAAVGHGAFGAGFVVPRIVSFLYDHFMDNSCVRARYIAAAPGEGHSLLAMIILNAFMSVPAYSFDLQGRRLQLPQSLMMERLKR